MVIGSRDPKAIELMHDIYAPLKRAKVPFLDTNVETAEMIKYASNGFLATKISFINEMATLCEAYGADVEMVARGMGLDDRIGPRFLHPGPGFGGSCFPKDTRAVSQIARERGLSFRIIDAVLEVNTATQARMVEKIEAIFGGELSDKTFGVLGLAFKANTDDVRETPALPILEGLHRAGARIRAYDPEAIAEFQKEFEHEIEYCRDEYEAAAGADALLILTDWNQFRALEFDRMRQLLTEPLVIDLRNLYEPFYVAKHGLRYVSVGRPDALPDKLPESRIRA
ncbi:MAG: nucleotide sugar dehydrogenase [Holophagales bacterium]|nr:nucleotide sugar dehydrogenase [Holophagales bacterium]